MRISKSGSRKIAVAGLLLLTLSVVAPFAAGKPAGRSGPSRIQLLARRASDRLAAIRKKRRTIRTQLIQKKQEEHTALGRLEATETALEAAQARVLAVDLKLQRNKEQLRVTTQRLARTRAQLIRRKKLLSNRLVDVYEGETVSYADVLLGSTDMWTFLTRATDIKRVIGSDVDLIQGIKKDEEQIKTDQAIQQRQVAAAKALKARYVSESDTVSGLVGERLHTLSEIQNDRQALEDALDELDRESENIQREIQRAMQTAKGRRRYATPFTGSLGAPINGPIYISSGFGYRFHPILHKVRLHTGVDIRARSGTPIYAAASGEVLSSGWRTAYGKCIIIDHGGGISTLYGHCSSLLCSKGQEVKKGQLIGRVGSTGWSTGPHLHFEKRENGNPVRPF